jgi:hypothetical protein
VGNLGDMELLVHLSEIVGHKDIAFNEALCVNVRLTHDARVVVGKVSRFYARIDFGIHCITTLLPIDFSKKTKIFLGIFNEDLDEPMAT